MNSCSVEEEERQVMCLLAMTLLLLRDERDARPREISVSHHLSMWSQSGFAEKVQEILSHEEEGRMTMQMSPSMHLS